MTRITQPLRPRCVAETPAVAPEMAVTPLLSEWMRCAHWWAESVAHGLPDADKALRAQQLVTEALENRFPADWAALDKTLAQWEAGLLHTAELPNPTCSRCNPAGAANAALAHAQGGAR